ncbi:MAG TPA: GAF domain-containing protein [Syntrophobacter fumaroxidans]|nr:GAF domain-containing protein [Syntrophobacter fumaroxidans]
MSSFNEKVALRSFQEISKLLSSTMELPEILNHILEEITRVLGLKGGTIRLVSPKTNTLEWMASVGVSRKYIEKGAVDLDKSVAEAMTGTPVLVLDAGNDPRMQYPKQAREEGIASMLTIPMKARGGKVIGVMRLVTSEPRQFTMDEVDFACAVGELGAQAITNARMFEELTKELKYFKGMVDVAKFW